MSRPAALVTGAAVRLGRALALGLAEDGHDIALHFGRSEEAARETAAEIEALGVRCARFPHDLRDARGLDGLVGRVVETFPHLGILVNSASAYAPGGLRQADVDTWDTQQAVNLRAPFFLTAAFARRVQDGLVVNILDNKIGYAQHAYAAYLLPKKALAELTVMAALELAPGIRVNGVAPGVVLPAGSRSPEYLAWRVQGIPVQRAGGPADIVRAVRYLRDSPFVTGQVLTVDGGENVAWVGRKATDWDPSGV